MKTGARLALDYVSLARTYPNYQLPKTGFAQAFEEVQLEVSFSERIGKVQSTWNTLGPIRITRGSYGIGILKSMDGGATWEKSLDWSVDQRRAVQKIAINPQNPSSVWAATTEGTYRTQNKGASWELVHDIKMATDIAINPDDTSKVFITYGGMGSLGHGVYISENAGVSFEKVNLIEAGGPAQFFGKPVLNMAPSNPDIVMVSIGNSNGNTSGSEESTRTWLMRTENGGDKWSTEFVNNDYYATFQGWYSHAIAIHPTNSDIVWATGQPQLLFKSMNGGSNLDTVLATPANPPGPNDFDNVYPFLSNWADHHDIVFHPKNPEIIYFINDGGINWENINANLPEAVFAMDLIISRANRKLRVATHGNGAYEMNLSQGSSTETNGAIPKIIKLGNNYPNPFNPSTIILYELSEHSLVSLKVYDINGRLVRTLIDRVQRAGEFFIPFESESLPSGTYFYQLKVGNEVSSKKMLLIK